MSSKAIENKKVLEVVQNSIIEIDIKFSDDKGTRLLENKTIPIFPIFDVDAVLVYKAAWNPQICKWIALLTLFPFLSNIFNNFNFYY